MRAPTILIALALSFAATSASAMCGGMGQQSQSAASNSGGMCGSGATQAEDPFGMKQSQPQQRQGMGMCPCCRNMAMMGGSMNMQGDDPHKGMNMQK